ncbi:MAG: hypothetical protein U0Z44_15035 [Kouleothrix sp.]
MHDHITVVEQIHPCRCLRRASRPNSRPIVSSIAFKIALSCRSLT